MDKRIHRLARYNDTEVILDIIYHRVIEYNLDPGSDSRPEKTNVAHQQNRLPELF